MDVTIEVTNVNELGVLAGDTSLTYAEGGTDAVETYTVSAGDGSTVTWDLDGADSSHFMLEGTGMSRMLKFSSAPDYENPMGGDDDDSNTYMVTVMAKAGGETKTVDVTIEVTNVNELGVLAGDTSLTYAEGGTDAVETYTVSAGDGSTVTWDLDGADSSHFMLEGTGMSRMLKFSSAPDYEKPDGRRRRRLQHLHGHRHGLGRRRNGHAGSHRHGHQRGGGRNGNPGSGAAQR